MPNQVDEPPDREHIVYDIRDAVHALKNRTITPAQIANVCGHAERVFVKEEEKVSVRDTHCLDHWMKFASILYNGEAQPDPLNLYDGLQRFTRDFRNIDLTDKSKYSLYLSALEKGFEL
jgi:hypothetical protein